MVHDRNDIGEVGCGMRKEECCVLQDLVEIIYYVSVSWISCLLAAHHQDISQLLNHLPFILCQLKLP